MTTHNPPHRDNSAIPPTTPPPPPGGLVVDTAGRWRLYTQTLPLFAEPLGTIRRNGVESGALVRLATGRLVQINAGVIRNLDQHSAEAALAVAIEKEV